MRARSKKALRRAVEREISAWEESCVRCVLTGAYCERLHTHHYLTKGGHPALEFCLLNRLQILPSLHVEKAHGKDRNGFDAMVEQKFPGLREELLRLEREVYSRLPLDEVLELARSQMQVDHERFWRAA